MAWEPVLDGRLADEAWAAVRAIADHLDDAEPAHRVPVDAALFWAYAAGALDDDASQARFAEATDRLFDHIERGFRSLALHGGLAGAGWVLTHISDTDEDLAAGLREIDAGLIAHLEEVPWRDNYDLIGGLVGLGVYFLERQRGTDANSQPGITRGLALVVEQLAALAQPAAGGVTWHTAPEIIPWHRDRWPTGYYNLGVAHGVPGAIALLGAVAALPAPELAAVAARARELCEAATRWLRTQRLSPDPVGRFSSMIDSASPGAAAGPPERARTAWCYGDPGIAATLWAAAAHLGADAAEWRELAREVAARPFELCRVADPNFCHGAAGLAHLCNRFYQASGEPEFRDAAHRWYERALAMRRPGEGIAGFTTQRSPITEGGSLVLRASQELLDGATGVGLVLLAGLRDEEPGWDRLVLCDIPVRDPA